MDITYEELYRNSKPEFIIQMREIAVKLYLQGNKTVKHVCKEFIGSLDITFGQHIFPKEIWTDSEGVFISKDLERFCKKSRVKVKHIKPGKPNENCIVERSVRTVREEVLDQYWFNNPEELQQALNEFKEKYNNRVFRKFKQTPNERYLDWIMNRKK